MGDPHKGEDASSYGRGTSGAYALKRHPDQDRALFSRQQALSPLKGAKDFAFTFVRSFKAESPRFSASKYALYNYECVITDEDEGN